MFEGEACETKVREDLLSCPGSVACWLSCVTLGMSEATGGLHARVCSLGKEGTCALASSQGCGESPRP